MENQNEKASDGRDQTDNAGALGLAAGSALGNDEIIYSTGCTPDGIPLIGGVWTLRDQEGFPLEMSQILCQQNNWRIDWMEAMADASRSNNCPALMKAVEVFLPESAITHLKMGFVHMVRSGKTFDEVLAEKRANGKKMLAFVHAVAVELSKQNTQAHPRDL